MDKGFPGKNLTLGGKPGFILCYYDVMSPSSKNDWVACPHCGGTIKRNAAACRHCGSDDRTGWSEVTYLDGIDLPDEEDYAEGLVREGFRESKASGKKWLLGAVSALLVGVFLIWMLRGLF